MNLSQEDLTIIDIEKEGIYSEVYKINKNYPLTEWYSNVRKSVYEN